MTSLKTMHDLGGWTPEPMTQMETTPPPRDFGRTRKLREEELADYAKYQKKEILKPLHTHITNGREKEVLEQIKEIKDRGFLDKDLLAELMRSAILAHQFRPSLVEALEKEGASSGLIGKLRDPEKDIWAICPPQAWAYALNRLDGQPHLQDFVDNCMQKLAKMNFRDNPERLMVLWEHDPSQIGKAVRSEKEVHLAGMMDEAMKSGNEKLMRFLLHPNELGMLSTVKEYVKKCTENMRYNQLLWLGQFLKDNPECAKTWDDAFPVAAIFRKWGDWRRFPKLTLKNFHKPTKQGNPEHAASTNFVGHLIASENGEIVRTMAHFPSGRAALLDAVLSDPYILASLLVNQSNHGICESDLLAWDRERVCQWRDDNGCCMAHYALAVQSSNSANDRVLVRLLNLVPEWRNVVRNDGVSLLSFFVDPEAQARSSRKEIKEVTKDIKKLKPSTASLPKRRM